ncbi:ATP-dependent helicase HrpB [Antarcticirhabdus aurantiaca]|uniref:ATP-dependent helicase HrpB n=1 Tax=Antarcticirhabdus aurantiaca TaxID=2606717 RepID=UPI00131B3770|nr:ATP-dependent helicase HrpB [Antarcticirhabdus aurantiaca]
MTAALPELPVSAVLPDVSRALEEARRAVLVAPPGAGKTTLVPLHLLSAGWLGQGRILLVEPRRLAARASARRMASILGEEVGDTVGWRMRLDTRVSKVTRIEVVTEGVFSRMILGDPELTGIAAVLFDEFHERSLDADWGLALALDAAGVFREDLRILVMSATLDGARVAALLGNAPVIESAGRAFPIAIRYRDRPGTEPLEDAVAGAIREALREEPGSILAFLPGQREIERTAERLERSLPPDVILAPLFGAMEGAAQDVAVKPAPAGRRKVVLATSIAETSLTIDGVTVVVDGGYRRKPVFEPATGLSRLETARVSRAAADQRAGRAGRTAPGTAIRLWREEQTAALDAFDQPEILSTDLSGLLLDAAAWGLADPASLAFLDPPPKPALKEARALLQSLGALDPDDRLTPLGEAMRALPLPPRLARMVAGAPVPARETAAELAVLLTEPGLGGTDPDLAERLRRYRAERSGRAQGARGLARRIAGLVPRDLAPVAAIEPEEIGAILALGYADRLAVGRGSGRFTLASGRGGVIDEASPLARARFLCVADLTGQAKGGRIRAAASVDEASLPRVAAGRLIEEDEIAFDAGAREVRARRVRRIGKAVIAETPLASPKGEGVAAALGDGIRRLGFAALPLSKENGRLLRRLRFLAAAYGSPPWPDLSDKALLDGLEDWLLPYAPGASRLSDLSPDVIEAGLRALAPTEAARQLDALAPTHFEAPTGNRHPIRFEEEGPVLAIRVQELFGLTRHPAIAGGRLPLILELLSPAQRPIQVTRDLPGFWAGSWRDVRADLRGRYPKHPWPEDPASAPPTARAKPRGT